jgi:hypothetical protein
MLVESQLLNVYFLYISHLILLLSEKLLKCPLNLNMVFLYKFPCVFQLKLKFSIERDYYKVLFEQKEKIPKNLIMNE